LAALEELTEIGMALARRLVAGDAEASEAQTGGRDAGLAFSRIARAVRMTVALGDRLEQPAEVRWPQARASKSRAAEKGSPGDEPEESAEDKERMQAGMRGVIISATVVSAVEEAIEAEVEGDIGGPEAERLLDALYERLDDDEMEAIGRRSTGESVALICQALGLTPDWSVWEFEPWAMRESREKTEGSPYGRPRRKPPVGWDDEPGPVSGEADQPPDEARELEVLDSAFGSP
jgi:hypothetical protein